MPFVSVIFVTHTLGEVEPVLEALARQSFTDFEVVVADYRHDERKADVRRLAWARFLDVRHLGITPAPPVGSARGTLLNAAIAAATGDAVLFLEEGARPAPDLVERHARFHLADPTDRGAMVGAVRGRGVAALTLLAPGRVRAEKVQRLLNASVLRRCLIEVGGVDEEFNGGLPRHQDEELASRLTAQAGVAWLSDPSAALEVAEVEVTSIPVKGTAARSGDLLARRRAEGFPVLPSQRLIHMKGAERVDLGHDAPDLPRAPEPREGGVGEVSATLPGAVERIPVDLRSVAAERPLRVAMIYGEFSSAIHGPFDLARLGDAGLTGSESSFFSLATSLAEMGHEVVVFCVCREPVIHPSGWQGVPIEGLNGLAQTEGLDAVVAWNEPDYLRYAPPGVRRFCDQQLNDFGYCRDPEWRSLVDVWVSPSTNHAANVMRDVMVARGAPQLLKVIPNPVDLDLFAGPAPARDPRRVVWCSSPDRGLHHLLSMWPEVRRRVSDATLRVFYRLRPWLERAIDAPDEVGRRARYIAEVLPRLARLGVEVHDSVPNRRMAEELRSAACLAYPCDPVRYTEGFGCSVLDAAAGGCVPIISAADALPSVHGSAAIGIPGPPGQMRPAWVEAISAVLSQGAPPTAIGKMRAHADAHDRRVVARQWVSLLARHP